MKPQVTWTPISTRPDHGVYLVVLESPFDRPLRTTGFWNGEEWLGDWADQLYVIAWMPLPEYP